MNFKKCTFFHFLFLCAVIFTCSFLIVCLSIWLREPASKTMRYGITYSTVYAQYLGLDVMKTYQDLVENLGVQAVRLPVYWSEIESVNDVYDWNQLDALIKYSEEHGVKLTLAIGRKVPRWPECFVPNWAQKVSKKDQILATHEMVAAIVMRYRSSSAIERWQVENEPFLPFGVCEQMTKKELQAEVELVRRLDTKPIQVTVSGEVGPWKETLRLGDVFGISVYRITWNPVFGYFTYPFSPLYYRARAIVAHVSNKTFIVSELQAEPWFSEDIKQKPVSYWYELFRAEELKNHIQFVKETGVTEVYLWGAEWWAYLKEYGENRLWEEAKKLFRDE